MKTIQLLLLLVFSFGYSQCKLVSSYDKFEKVSRYETEMFNIIKGGKGFQMFLQKVCKESECLYTIGIMNVDLGCKTDKSYIQFLTDKGETIRINYTAEIDCGNFPYGRFYATESQMQSLLKANITDVRVSYEYYEDLQLTDKLKQRMKDAFNCIVNAKQNNL